MISRRWLVRIVFVVSCVAALVAEIYVVFVNRGSSFTIHGASEYAVTEFQDRRPVRHAFLMNGDGLTAVSVLVSGDRHARATIKWTILRGTPDQADSLQKVSNGLDTFELTGRRQWRTFSIVRDGSSHDRWYTIEVTMIDLAPADAHVELIATSDNPDRGGVLWADTKRQPGSLVIEAKRLGRTPYMRFKLEAERNLPRPLRVGAVQWALAGSYHIAVLLLAYAFARAGGSAAAIEIDSRPYAAVVSLQPLDATTTLFFRNLRERTNAPLRIVQYPSTEFAGVIGGASAIVLVRALFECPAAVRFAARFNVPVLFFLDDNFITLREEPGPAATFVQEYTRDAVRTALAPFAGVLLATAPLVEYFRTHQLHGVLTEFGPTMSAQVVRINRGDGPLTLAFFGGSHLHDVFRNVILPAIQRLAERRPVRLIAVGVDDVSGSAALTVVRLPHFSSYRDGLAALANEGVDVLLHPVVDSANTAYKNPHALITAAALGSAVIVSRRAPYDGTGDVALLAEDSAESWLRQLEIAADVSRRSTMVERLRAYCASAFAGSANAARLKEAVHTARRPHALQQFVRVFTARRLLIVDRLERLVRR